MNKVVTSSFLTKIMSVYFQLCIIIKLYAMIIAVIIIINDIGSMEAKKPACDCSIGEYSDILQILSKVRLFKFFITLLCG